MWFVATPHVTSPSEQPPRLQVVKIALVGIGLTLKRNVAIGISTHRQPHEPLEQIGDEEEHEQHLALLRRVDAFVIHHLIAQIHPRMHKQNTQQVDGRETLEWQYRRPHNFHSDKVTTIFRNPTFYQL